MLIVIGIIGVIIVIMLTLVKPSQSVLKLQYYGAYNVLATAAYNIYDKALDENKVMYENAELCAHLRDYINNNSPYSCNESYVNLNGKNFNNDNIQFIASNGMVFYMSQSFVLNDFGKDQKHRIVWVDVNGKRHPNTAEWKENVPADIVAFDITDTGEVVPLGYPKVDPRYMTAKVVFTDEITKPQITTFFQSQNIAFGEKQYEYEVFSYTLDQTNPIFNGSELRIAQKYLNKEKAPQDDNCINNEDELFPKCSLDIIK